MKRVKVLEKSVRRANTELYVMESENGERLKLRCYKEKQDIK